MECSGIRLQATVASESTPVSSHIKVTDKIDQALLFQAEVQEVQKEVIGKIVKVSQGFSATFFLKPTKDGGMRPVISLKHLNRFIHTPTFRMYTPQPILNQ